MTKQEITEAAIDVFKNGATGPFVNGIHYQIILPGIIYPHWVYPIGLVAINPMHPFIHVNGGYEEKPLQASFNHKLCESMIALYAKSFFHNRKISTKTHKKIKRNDGKHYDAQSENPDLFEVNKKNKNQPSHEGFLVFAASQAGHNFICQTTHGIYNKICEELWRLSESGIKHCFFIALYTHKQYLKSDDICLPSYRGANQKADHHYPTELNTYRNDICQIDPDYIHLIFRGVRPNGENTYFHVFVIEKSNDLILVPKGSIVRPKEYQSH